MKTAIVLLIGCGMLVAAGYVHGLWTDRWNDGSDLAQAAARLERMPLKVGEWTGKRVEHESDARAGLAGSVTYQFTSAKTGKSVTVFLACGRSGPVSVHTPEVCYAGSGFDVEKPARFASTRPGLEGHGFFTSRLVRKRSSEQTTQRIFWAWNAGQTWEAPDYPRMTFARTPVLFKMYVIRELTGTSESPENDPCVELMEALIPALQSEGVLISNAT